MLLSYLIMFPHLDWLNIFGLDTGVMNMRKLVASNFDSERNRDKIIENLSINRLPESSHNRVKLFAIQKSHHH